MIADTEKAKSDMTELLWLNYFNRTPMERGIITRKEYLLTVQRICMRYSIPQKKQLSRTSSAQLLLGFHRSSNTRFSGHSA